MCFATSHSLAKELLRRTYGFLTVSIDGKEYLISNIRRVSTCANIDDSNMYWTLQLNNENEGNIKSDNKEK